MKTAQSFHPYLARVSGIFFLVAVLTACAPPATLAPPTPPPVASPQSTFTASAVIQTGTPAPEQPGGSTPLAVATSRGPNLEATDPATVQLDSGGPQLVEFFRFT